MILVSEMGHSAVCREAIFFEYMHVLYVIVGEHGTCILYCSESEMVEYMYLQCVQSTEHHTDSLDF